MDAECGDRTGLLVVGGYRIRPETVPTAKAALRGLDVNVAISAGKL